MEVQIKYTTMLINDMEESVKFYRDVLGFEVDGTYRLPPEGDPVIGSITTMRSKKGDTMIELIKNDMDSAGFYSIGMEVTDMDEAMSQMRAKGVKILAGPAPTVYGCCSFIEDPNGVRICLIYHAA